MVPTLLAGDHLIVRRGRIRVGDLVALRDPRGGRGIVVKRVIKPAAHGWWVEGDNAAASTDSRLFGAVPRHLLLGRVVYRYAPASRAGRLRRVR